jgi:hypothetical protein
MRHEASAEQSPDTTLCSTVAFPMHFFLAPEYNEGNAW